MSKRRTRELLGSKFGLPPLPPTLAPGSSQAGGFGRRRTASSVPGRGLGVGDRRQARRLGRAAAAEGGKGAERRGRPVAEGGRAARGASRGLGVGLGGGGGGRRSGGVRREGGGDLAAAAATE